MTPETIVLVLAPAQLSLNGNRLTRWAIKAPDGRTLAAGKRATALSYGRPYFTQDDAADILRRAKLPVWRHVRAADVHRYQPAQGYRLDSIELRRGADGALMAYRLTCVLDDDRGDFDARYQIAGSRLASDRVAWMTYFCGDACAQQPVATMGAALAMRDAFEHERQTAMAGCAV